MNESTNIETNGATATSRADLPAGRQGNRERWRGLVTEQRASGESKRAFCRGRGISYPSFLQWSRRLAEDEAAGSAGAFCELRVAAPPAPAAFEIAAGGVVVRVASGFDAGELARLLRAVFEAAGSLGEAARSFGGASRFAVETSCRAVGPSRSGVGASRRAGEAGRPC